MTGGNATAALAARSGISRRADWRYRLAVGWREPTAAIGVLLANLSSGIQTYPIGGWQPPYGIVLVGAMIALAQADSTLAKTIGFIG